MVSHWSQLDVLDLDVTALERRAVYTRSSRVGRGHGYQLGALQHLERQSRPRSAPTAALSQGPVLLCRGHTNPGRWPGPPSTLWGPPVSCITLKERLIGKRAHVWCDRAILLHPQVTISNSHTLDRMTDFQAT